MTLTRKQRATTQTLLERSADRLPKFFLLNAPVIICLAELEILVRHTLRLVRDELHRDTLRQKKERLNCERRTK